VELSSRDKNIFNPFSFFGKSHFWEKLSFHIKKISNGDPMCITFSIQNGHKVLNSFKVLHNVWIYSEK
jgi:hypothetical protein